jgi:hypothetical protein
MLWDGYRKTKSIEHVFEVPMSEESKLANAAAKAAKAEAKALRPFYKKKRYWAIALVAVIAIATATSGGSSTEVANGGSSSETGGESSQTEDTVSSGLGSKDASDDIVDIDCGSPDALDFSYAKVTIKNNSSKASDYFVTVVYESADGATRYGDTMIMVNALESGQTITESGLPVSDIPSGAICKVTEVQRTAS